MSDVDQTQELRLVQQAKAGDTEAFGRLYELHAQAVFRFLVTKLGNPQEAEDLTIEVFLRVWRALPEYEVSGTPLSSYIFRIARNLLIDVYRSQARTDPAVSIEGSELEEILPDSEQKIPEPDRYEALYRAMLKLRDDYRDVLILRFLNEMNIEEISEIMDRSAGAVRVLQHRALGALRKVLTAGGEN